MRIASWERVRPDHVFAVPTVRNELIAGVIDWIEADQGRHLDFISFASPNEVL